MTLLFLFQRSKADGDATGPKELDLHRGECSCVTRSSVALLTVVWAT